MIKYVTEKILDKNLISDLNDEINKWIDTGFKIIYEIKQNDIFINFDSDKEEITITCPTTSDDVFCVDCKTKYKWLDSINIYCIDNKPNIKKLINILFRKITKEHTIEKNDNFDIIKYMKFKELNDIITKNNQTIISENKNIQPLFDNNCVLKIILNEYMEIWENCYKGKLPYNVEIIDNNICKWKIKFNNFQRKDLNESLHILNYKFKYSHIELNLLLNNILYPNYPPLIKIVKPKLLDSLAHKISNAKMIKVDYWTPTRSISNILNKLFKILDKHARIDINNELNDIDKYLNNNFMTLENHLLTLTSLTNTFIDDNDPLMISINNIDDEKYQKNNKIFSRLRNNKKKDSNKENKTIWKTGTGYGYSGINDWNIDSYIKLCIEHDTQIKNVLNNILEIILDSKDPLNYLIIQDSILIKYFSQKLQGLTLLEMEKHQQLYKIIFKIIKCLTNENAIFLFDDIFNKYFTNLHILCIKSKKINKDINDDDLVNIICNIYDGFEKALKIYQDKIINQNDEFNKKNNDLYVSHMIELRDSDNPLNSKIINTNYHYQKEFNENKSYDFPKSVLKRLYNEISTFNDLPIFSDAMIISRYDETCIRAIRTLITGPVNTPYECGIFLFDTYINSEFPNKAPNVWFLNTGNKRFNPNLYEDGKVCLSILGTWEGGKGEVWHPTNSSLIQIYISIQSQILIEEPFYNEPNYEKIYNSSIGKINSIKYNNNIKLYTMEHAMLDLIKNPYLYPQFADVCKVHFVLKRDKIISLCEKWTNEAPESLKSKYTSLCEKIKEEIIKLKIGD
jgi:Ubiquitin-protein ligase